MHVIFRESHGLEETETPTALGQSPADLVVLSLSDSDLGAFAAGWHRSDGKLPSLRLANIAALKHPLSVDTYVEQTLSGAKGILIRLIGGVPYWPYGLQQIEALARAQGIALAVLPADGRPDPRLDEISTLPISTLRQLQHLCDAGGEVAAQAALQQMALASGLYAGPVPGHKGLPGCGIWTPDQGACGTCPCPSFPCDRAAASGRPLVAVTFYRSYLVSSDLAPIQAIFDALDAQGFDAIGLFANSLKAPDSAAWLAETLQRLNPVAIVNATSFSGKGASGTSPLDAAEVPVFQVALATSTESAWAEAERGLSPADLAMHVVLPEVDGRLFGGVASFKEPQPQDDVLQFSRYVHTPHLERIQAVVARIAAWHSLSRMPAENRRVALILSTYPGRDWNLAHAVGLDAIASADAIMADLRDEGHAAPGAVTADDLQGAAVEWTFAEYETALAKLPALLRKAVTTAWGDPQNDPLATATGLRLPILQRGKTLVALQPERGTPDLRDDEYHDLSRTPRHAYVAFYLWMQAHADALIHIGAHGTLEWLPGKAVALSDTCWPEVLTGTLPVIYPFIVNDPGEAAQAKRRIGALTLGHVPPPLKASGTPLRLSRLEALLDEFSNADGLDPKRRDRLQGDIRAEAQALGDEDDLGLEAASCVAEAITRIDRFVCDVKDSQFGDGLHVWGRPEIGQDTFDSLPSADAERASLLAALNGRRIAAGPAGSPYRGRTDVLPTGRNLFTTDPRSVPTRAAYDQGIALADELIRRHLQDHGDYPTGLIVDLWGSATMSTAGEEFAMALAMLGVRPVWDEGSERVSGLEVLPIAELDRPRIDVTLRVSGLFRDVFPTLSTLFQQAIRTLADRDEATDWNPYVGAASARVYGPQPGQYGVGIGAHLGDYSEDTKRAAGEAWLAASSYAMDGDAIVLDAEGLRARIAGADAFVHLQDMPETDVLISEDYATHEAGFAAAKAVIGGKAALYHLDVTDSSRPRARALTEEIARVVQARASNPDWIAGMRRHGFRGAAEIAATLENLSAFAQLADVVPSHHFDLYFDATLNDPETLAILEKNNPEALRAMRDRFAALHAAGLWETRRNSILAALEAAE